MRSPITQNGRSGPMTTVLDGDWTTVSTRLSFLSWWDAELLTQPGDSGLAAKADQVEAGDSRQRPRVLGELDRDLETLRLRVGCPLAALDERRGYLDARHVLVHVAQGRGRAGQTDGRQQRGLLGESLLDRLGEERVELIGTEGHLQLQEARTCLDLLQRAIDPVVERRSARILDCAEEELRRRIDLSAGEIRASR